MLELPKNKIGWLFPNNSILRPLFDRFFMKHRENGVIAKLKREFMKNEVTCPTEPFNQIDFKTLGVLFGLLLSGILLALFTIGIEKARFLSGSLPCWVFEVGP